jgi:arabinose-5-phosphate isomerase
MNQPNLIEIAKEVISIEIEGLQDISAKLDDAFTDAVELILSSKGRTIFCGMGKSGIIGKKITASLASTGTPSFFMHPGEAFHGDLGMVHCDDVFVAISNSGETEEVLKLLPFLMESKNKLIAMTGNPNSTLALQSDCHINVGVNKEACPLQLAPTSSTTAALVMGDALTVALMKCRDFMPENFARFHPGGSLGRRLLNKVEDEMIHVDLPLVNFNTAIVDVIQTMTNSTFGVAVVVEENKLRGIITDGDLRRAINRGAESAFKMIAKELYTPDPLTIQAGSSMQFAFELMESKSVTTLIVLNNDKVVGIVKK